MTCTYYVVSSGTAWGVRICGKQSPEYSRGVFLYPVLLEQTTAKAATPANQITGKCELRLDSSMERGSAEIDTNHTALRQQKCPDTADTARRVRCDETHRDLFDRIPRDISVVRRDT